MQLPPALSGFFGNNRSSPGGTIQFFGLESRTYVDLSSIDTALGFLPFSPEQRQCVTVADSCAGLLLLYLKLDRSLWVCNPATRKWETFSLRYSCRFPLVLVFDPRRSPHYRVISFVGDQDVTWSGKDINVFSSETGEWKETFVSWRRTSDHDRIDRPKYKYYLKNGSLTLSNGVLYVFNAYGRTLAVDLDENASWLVRIDVDPKRDGTWRNGCIGHSQGLLHLARISLVDKLFVWVLEDPRNNRYTLKHQCRLEGLSSPQVLAFHPDLDVVFLKTWLLDRVFGYHLKSGKLEEISDIDVIGSSWYAYTPCYSDYLGLREAADADFK